MNKIGPVYFNGKYEEYLEYKERAKENVIEEKISNNQKKNTNNSYFQDKEIAKRKNKIKKLELEIEEKENDIKKIKDEMQCEDICTDYIKLKELQDKIEIIEKEIEIKMGEWEALSEICK